MQENPLKAAVLSADGQQRIDVVVKQATLLKRTLLQVTGECHDLTSREGVEGAPAAPCRAPPATKRTSRAPGSSLHALPPPLSPLCCAAPAAAAAAADISQLGSPRDVAKLLLPPGATVLALDTASVAQPPRDTGTVVGVIQRDPVTYYT